MRLPARHLALRSVTQKQNGTPCTLGSFERKETSHLHRTEREPRGSCINLVARAKRAPYHFPLAVAVIPNWCQINCCAYTYIPLVENGCQIRYEGQKFLKPKKNRSGTTSRPDEVGRRCGIPWECFNIWA